MTSSSHKETVKTIFVLAGLHEAFFAIPIAGLLTTWTTSLMFPVISGLVVHGLALYQLRRIPGAPEGAPAIGLVASFLAFVPVIGWVFHVITVVLYVVTYRVLFGGGSVMHAAQGSRSVSGRGNQRSETQRRDDTVIHDAEIID